MVFIHDTGRSLAAVVDLVNTLPGHDDPDTLQTLDDLDRFLAANPYTGRIARSAGELTALRGIRSRLRASLGCLPR